MRWLSDLKQKLKEVPAKYLITEGAIGAGERVVGQLPNDLLRLWGYQLQVADEIRAILERHTRAHLTGATTEKSYRELRDDFEWAVRQHLAILQIFWVSVRSEFDLYAGGVGIRAHGTVVAIEKPTAQELDGEALRALLEQIDCGGKPN